MNLETNITELMAAGPMWTLRFCLNVDCEAALFILFRISGLLTYIQRHTVKSYLLIMTRLCPNISLITSLCVVCPPDASVREDNGPYEGPGEGGADHLWPHQRRSLQTTGAGRPVCFCVFPSPGGGSHDPLLVSRTFPFCLRRRSSPTST